MFHVLILDDDPFFCRVLSRSLERNPDLPCRTVTATSADEAERAVAQASDPFDVFLIDQRLGPGPDGIDVLQNLLRLSPDSSAVVFTQQGDDEAGMRAYRAGAYRYMYKTSQPEELVLVLRSLRDWRETRRERDWLRVLTEIAEAAQRVLTVSKVSEVIVRAAPRFGFARARLWLLDTSAKALIGCQQYGNTGLDTFAGTSMPLDQAPYAAQVVQAREPVIWSDLSSGETFLQQHFGDKGFLPSSGEWVGLPLWSGAQCLGALMLDGYTGAGRFGGELLQSLALFGQQVAAALARAQLYEREIRHRTELEMLSELGRRISSRAAEVEASALLWELRNLVGRWVRVDSFMLVLRDPSPEQLDIRLHTENGEQKRRRRVTIAGNLAGYIIERGQPLLLTRDGPAFREQHGIRRHPREPRCWLGVPLLVEGVAFGAIVVQSFDRDDAYTDADQQLLTAVANQVAGAIRTALLREDAERDSRRLAMLQRVGRELMRLAMQKEEWLWHATLTAATADYALEFNRAMLFLINGPDEALRGWMGIGQLSSREARVAWKRDLRRKFTFDEYLRHLQEGQLPSTPVDAIVRDLELPPCGSRDAFQAALRERRCVLVEEREVAKRLPPEFVEAFKRTDYALLPLFVGDRPLGVLVVDNIHNQEPLRERPLKQLETLLAQVALVHENARQRAATDQFIDVNHAVLAQVADLPLKDTLVQICAAAQRIVGADCTLVYPLVPGTDINEPVYDIDNTGHFGLREDFLPREKPGVAGVTTYVLQSSEPVTVDHVDTYQWPDGQHRADSPFLQREGICAFIAVPIHDVTTDAISGILYLNYRTPQSFSRDDVRRAVSFASLAGAAIRSGRARERELEIIRGVLETALRPEVDRDTVVRALLEAAGDLLDRLDARVALVLREWSSETAQNGRSSEVRRQYLVDGGRLITSTQQRVDSGITGHAFRTREDQLVRDVSEPEWARLYQVRTDDPASSAAAPTRSELDVLIRLEGQTLGLFNIEAPTVAAFSETDRQILRRLAAAAAFALDNLRRQEHLRGVLSAAEAVITPTRLSETLDAVLEAIRRIAPDVSTVTIWYKDVISGRVQLGKSFGVNHPEKMQTEAHHAHGSVLTVMEAAGPIWAAHVHDDPRLTGRFAHDERIVSSAAFPLRADGETVGAMFFSYRQTHEFTREEGVLFPILVTIAAISVRDALRLEALHNERDRLKAAIDITEAVGATLDLGETLRRIMRTLSGLFPDAQPCVLIHDDRKHTLEFHPASLEFYRIANPDRAAPLDLNGARGIVCRVGRRALQYGEVVWENVGDVQADPDYYETIPETRSELCLGLMSVDQRLLGVLALESARRARFRDDDVALVRGIGPAISIAIEQAKRSAELSFRTSVANATAWAADFAHDINHEIALIDKYAYVLKPALPVDQQALAEKIRDSAHRLQAYSGLPRVNRLEEFALDSWLGPRVTKFAAPFRERVECRFEPGCDERRVRASRIHVERVLRHLMRNAAEAMEGPGQLTVRTVRRDGFAEVQVSNNGPPIPEDVRQRLFREPVTTKRDSHGENGGGHGLLFARWAVMEMGGSIELISQPGEEVTFAFTLPFA